MSISSYGYHKVQLNSHCRADITWWRLFCEKWNGISFFPINPSSSILVVSDASGSWGCGAFIKSSHHWFQLEWLSHWKGVAIMVKELVPVVVSTATWGQTWSNLSTCFTCDNLAKVQALTKRTSRDLLVLHLLRCLSFFEAHFRFRHSTIHIPSRDNSAADALSWNRIMEFFSVSP